MDVKLNAYRVVVGKAEGKRPLGRPKRRWEVILRWNLYSSDSGERSLEGGSCEHSNKPSVSIIFWGFLEYLST
jgi:hypothetical protein